MKPNYQNNEAARWFQTMTENPSQIPFFFTYRGENYTGFSNDKMTLLSRENCKTNEKENVTLRFKVDDTLEATVLCTFYQAYGAAEWTVWFENTGNENSGILENPHTEMLFSGEKPVLKGIYGDAVNQYRPYAFELDREPAHFVSDIGRATHINFPYFNLEYGDRGVMLAIGWAGTWEANFHQTDAGVLYSGRSAINLKTYLKPGEKIRTALYLAAFYTVRDENYATNYWRNWFIHCSMPKADKTGAEIEPFSTTCFADDTGRLNSDGSISEGFDTWKPTMDKILEEKIPINFRWFDAGWYIAPDLGSADPGTARDWWQTVGTWELDPKKWPDKTFLASVEYAHEHGIKTLVWFEPERVTFVDDLVKNFGYKKEWAIERPDDPAISNNIGDPLCFRWTVDRIKKMLYENKVDMYREDNNCNPAPLWNYLDNKEGDDRAGITECKFIDAHYRMWDEFIACTLSYGGCGFVDSCASGGGRNDLESLRRGVPLLRSDSDRTTTALRLSMSSSFHKWVPLCGSSVSEKSEQLTAPSTCDMYTWRASYMGVLNVGARYVHDKEFDFDAMRCGMGEWKEVAPYLLKDFYVLTPWHPEKDRAQFTAFVYFDPETEKGVLLAFRQEDCAEDTLTVELPFLPEGKSCTLQDADTGDRESVESGKTLTLSFRAPRTARLLRLTM